MDIIRDFLSRNKATIIIAIVMWIVILLLVGCPLTMAIVDAENVGGTSLFSIIEGTINWFAKPLDSLTGAFSNLGVYVETSSKLTVIYIIILIFALIKARAKSDGEDYTNIEHGSSDWCEHGEQYKILDSKKGIILAEKNYLPVNKIGNVNVLVIGGSGAGKSASFVIPNAYQLLGSYVFTDPKGELYDKVAGYLKANGYEIKIFNLLNPKNSDGYNPLHHIRNELDVDVIANTIIRGQSDSNSSEPFWDDMSEMLLKALIYYLLSTRPPEEQNLASCSELVRAANNSGGDSLLSNLINQLPYDHPARMYYKSVELASDKTYSSILSSLQSKLGKFDSKEIADLTSTNTINFEDIGRKKTAVFVMSSDTHAAYDFLLTIFFAQMIQQLYDFADKEGGALKIPTYFILDEFANIGKIPDFDKKISTSRSRKISFSVIVQNLDQLEAIYKDSYETILGNCDTHLFLGSNSQKTVEYFSKALGEKTIVKDSVSISRDKNSKKQGYSTSDQSMARALMTPDELRRMDNDLCIIFEKGIKPVKARKYYYFKHPTVKYSQQYPADHNNVTILDRGVWRKYNPYNPYIDEENVEEPEIGSIDDLFDDIPVTTNKEDKKEDKKKNEKDKKDKIDEFDEFDDILIDEPKETKKEKVEEVEVDPFEDLLAPTFPQEDEKKEEDIVVDEKTQEEEELDIQKELERKFDELFENIDGNVTTSQK